LHSISTMHSKQTKKLSLLWLQGMSCNGNAHSFLNYTHLEKLLDSFTVLYHPILASQYTLEEVLELQLSCDVLIVEGSYNSTMYRGGVLFDTFLKHYAKNAQTIIAAGSCATYGGIFYEKDPKNSSGMIFTKEQEGGVLSNYKEKIINLPGCPIHPQWLGYVLEMVAAKKTIALDNQYRPQELFSTLAHHGCTRNEYFEWKVDADDFGKKEGCLFYNQGCRAPMTHASCNKILWNEVSSKTRIGTPCFGCTEADFPRQNLFSTKTNMSIPQDVPLGVSKRAYLSIVGIAKTFHIERLEGKLIDYKKTN